MLNKKKHNLLLGNPFNVRLIKLFIKNSCIWNFSPKNKVGWLHACTTAQVTLISFKHILKKMHTHHTYLVYLPLTVDEKNRLTNVMYYKPTCGDFLGDLLHSFFFLAHWYFWNAVMFLQDFTHCGEKCHVIIANVKKSVMRVGLCCNNPTVQNSLLSEIGRRERRPIRRFLPLVDA